MTHSGDPRPMEPFNPSGREHLPWVLTHPVALALFGVGCLGTAIFFATTPARTGNPDPAGRIVMILFGLGMAAVGLFALYSAKRRAAWQRDLAAWEQRQQAREQGEAMLRRPDGPSPLP